MYPSVNAGKYGPCCSMTPPGHEYDCPGSIESGNLLRGELTELMDLRVRGGSDRLQSDE